MSDPLPLGNKISLVFGKTKQALGKIKNNGIIFAALMLLIFGSIVRLFGAQPTLHAQAYTVAASQSPIGVQSPLFAKNSLFEDKNVSSVAMQISKAEKNGSKQGKSPSEHLAQKIYAVTGDAPIKEMVPFISRRNDKVAAFLVGIAKKESSFGLASPSKAGRDCYNYWGFKGEGGQGDSMGYACFASAQEAVNTVGDRIQALVDKNVTTPQKMVDTWKCGTSCGDDPGAPSWVSTVELYFNKIVS